MCRDGDNLLLREIATINRHFLHLVALIRVFEDDTHSLGFENRHSQKLEKLIDCVGGAVLLSGEPYLEINEEHRLQIAESDV